jgi:sialate O-acetylesterase
MKNSIIKSFGRLSVAVALILWITNQLFAVVVPASPFQDHMVLQRERIVPVWGKANPGETVVVTIGTQEQSVVAGKDGKWMVRLDPFKAGGPFQMTIKGENTVVINDIYIGEVWLCSGQSNMDMTVAREDRYWCGVFNEKEEITNANFPEIRVFDTAYTPSDNLQEQVEGKWELAQPETVGHFSAAAYFFGRELYQKYKVPIGLITTAYGASTAEAWISKPALEARSNLKFLLDNYLKKKSEYLPSLQDLLTYQAQVDKWKIDAAKAKADGKDELRAPKNRDPRVDQHNPCVLYNGMVAPLVPYAIRGAIWYQGESNANSVQVYRELMETLIADWRSAWGQGKFPFLYVQLANYAKTYDAEPAAGKGLTLVREAQLQNLSIPNTAMAVAIDNADPLDMGNIHPKNKQEIGHRLALAAIGKVYGEKIDYYGPLYDYYLIEGDKIRVSFSETGKGLVAKEGDLTGFAIAGADKNFVHAEAKIEGNTIVLSSPQVTFPQAVRYGWNANPKVNLYNKANLPASPFRTDNW